MPRTLALLGCLADVDAVGERGGPGQQKATAHMEKTGGKVEDMVSMVVRNH